MCPSNIWYTILPPGGDRLSHPCTTPPTGLPDPQPHHGIALPFSERVDSYITISLWFWAVWPRLKKGTRKVIYCMKDGFSNAIKLQLTSKTCIFTPFVYHHMSTISISVSKIWLKNDTKTRFLDEQWLVKWYKGPNYLRTIYILT